MNRRLKVGVLGMGLFLSLTLFASTAKAADYTVQPNDSLFKIGVVFDTSIEDLQEMNDLKTETILEGQVLTVPAKKYKVESGDSLYTIAEEHNLSISSLRIANDKWDNIIRLEDDILVPSSEGHERLKNLLYPSYYMENDLADPKLFDVESITLNTPVTATKEAVGTNKTEVSTTKSDSPVIENSSSKSVTSTSNSVINYSSEELDLLARLITAEATGQSYDAMVSVGAVVVNRVQDKDWPSTISSVINQVADGYYQFTPVQNGIINNPASSTALKAAKEALAGTDKSFGALYFFDNSSTSKWLWSRSITVRYDRMIFAK